MGLKPGSRLGPYEVVAPLGAGGMGDVYRARDTRFGRDVALKVPAVDRVVHSTARARFEREVAIVARLTHPGICTLLDAGLEGDQPYFVMELLRGETLATRLDRAGARGLPLHDTLDIATTICEALAFAHRHGVVHRDVKPANIMLTRSGVKLLDFGVARIRTTDDSSNAQSSTATLSITGTPAYMAPEQIDGRADPRADLFSVGAILYEMLAGQRAFPGQTSSDIIAAVLRCSPEPLAEARADVPAAVARIVQRCLRRDPDERWQSAADLGEALRWARDPDMQTVATRHRRPRRLVLAAWAAAALASLALGIAAVAPGRGSTFEPATEFYVDDIALPEGLGFVTGQTAWSRDGRRVAIVTQRLARDVVDFRIWTREIGAGEWQLVDAAGPGHLTYPSWSPDGASLAYFRAGKLARLLLPSRTPVELADAPQGRGTAWLDDDTIAYAPEPQGDIWRVPAEGGTPEVMIRRRPEDLGLKYPAALSGGHVLFWAQRPNPADDEIRVASTRDPESVHTVVRSTTAGAFSDGHLFFVLDNRIVSQPVDASTWAMRGRTEHLDVETGLGGNLGAPYVTAGGLLVGVQSARREASELTWVDRRGVPLGAIGDVSSYRTMALSPDGQQLLVESAAPGVDLASISLIDLQGGTRRHVVTDVGAMYPIWHPDQTRMAFRASRGPGGSGGIYEYSLGGRALRTLVETPTLAAARPAGWLDDRHLLWWATDVTGRFHGIFIRDANQSDRSYRTLHMGADVRAVAPRPDGHGLAYMSDESGVFEIYVDTFPAPRTAPWNVSRGKATLPKWSRDGRELFFVKDGALHVVGMTAADGGPTGPPRRLFSFEGRDYDVHPDGRLLMQRQRWPETHYLRVFRNWSNRTSAGEAGSLTRAGSGR